MADNDYPKEGKPMDTKDHPDTQDIPPASWKYFGSTMQVGDYAMPRAGDVSQYKVKGKDK